MDTLYIGDIPTDYHYAVFSSDYVTLYSSSSLTANNTYDYYRIYFNCEEFLYSTGETTISTYQSSQTLQDIDVSQNWLYRNDIDKIFVVCFCIILLFIFVFNIVTSVFKKGGVFGGLL